NPLRARRTNSLRGPAARAATAACVRRLRRGARREATKRPAASATIAGRAEVIREGRSAVGESPAGLKSFQVLSVLETGASPPGTCDERSLQNSGLSAGRHDGMLRGATKRIKRNRPWSAVRWKEARICLA